MSLKLDGLINEHDDRLLDEHLRTCDDCSLLWSAMRQADDVLWTSARQPLSPPSGFQMKVMAQVAVGGAGEERASFPTGAEPRDRPTAPAPTHHISCRVHQAA